MISSYIICHIYNIYDGFVWITQVTFADDEDLIQVSGTVGSFNGATVITSLSFHTNIGKTYGPYGQGGGTSFSLPVTKGKYMGFFGNYTDYLTSIGVILQP